jgi:hypothetical protein
VTTISPDQQAWIIRPLIDAGLGLDEIEILVFGLAFQAIISRDRDAVENSVSDQPAEVQAAWARVIVRMMTLHDP